MQVLTVAFIDGGQAGNVIPASVRFGGTFRFMTLEGYSYLKRRIKEVLQSFVLGQSPSSSSENFSTFFELHSKL